MFVTRALVTAAATAALLAVGTSPAVADGGPGSEPSPPTAVVEWFADQAGSVARDVLVSGSHEVGIGRDAMPEGMYTAGVPVPVYGWNEEFIEGVSDDAVEPTARWVAPLSRDGTIIGTITAVELPDGSVQWVSLNDDRPAGEGLARGGHGAVVADDELGGLVSVTDSGRAFGLSRVAAERFALVDSADELRGAMRAVRAGPGERGRGLDGVGAAHNALNPLAVWGGIVAMFLIGGAMAIWPRQGPSTVAGALAVITRTRPPRAGDDSIPS